MRRGLAQAWAPALLVLWPLLAYWPATSGQVLLGPGDGVSMFLPLRVFAAEAWRDGVLPLWNPWVFSGFPLLAGMTPGALHPLTLLYLVLPPATAMTWSALATLIACGLTTHAYARAIGCTRAAALFAGLTFAGSGFVVARFGNTPVLHATPWLPLLLVALERLRERARLRWVATGAAAIALAVFAGHPQVPFYTLGVAAAYALVRAAGATVGRIRYLALVWAVVALGLLLAAPQLLPTAELGAQSVRDRLPYDAFVEFALGPSQLATLLFPLLDAGAIVDKVDVRYNAPLEQAGYVGVAAIVLALATLATWRRAGVAAFWGAVAGVSLLMVLGDATPLARLAHHLPGYNLFRICTRNFFQFDLAVAVLAAIGLSRAQRHLGGGWLVAAAVATTATMAGVALPALRASTLPMAVLVVPLATGMGVMLLALLLARRPSPVAIALLLLLQAVDLFLYAQGLQTDFPTTATALREPDWMAPLRAAVGDGRAVIAQAGGVAPTDYRPALHGVRLVQGYDSLLIRRYGTFAGDMDYAGRIPEAELVGAPQFLDLLDARTLLLAFTDCIDAPVRERGATFAYPELAVTLGPGEIIDFVLPEPRRVAAVGVMSFLGGAVGVGDGDAAARITVADAAGGVIAALRAGEHTAEWAWDRGDLTGAVRHRRASIAEVFSMNGTPANKYVGVVALATPIDAVHVRVENTLSQSVLQLARISLLGVDGNATPLTLAHLLLDRPDRWARRATLRAADPMRFAPPLLGAAPIRALLTPDDIRSRTCDARVVVLENRRVLPLAWLVPRTLAVDAAGALASVRTGRLPDGTVFDPRAVALVEGAAGREFGPPDPAATAAVVSAAPERLEIATRSRAGGFLVSSEVDYPGWTATVDGRPEPVLRTNGVLRGVALDAGAHRVVFEFRPVSVRRGLWLAAAALLGFVGAAGVRWRRRGG